MSTEPQITMQSNEQRRTKAWAKNADPFLSELDLAGHCVRLFIRGRSPLKLTPFSSARKAADANPVEAKLRLGECPNKLVHLLFARLQRRETVGA